MSRCKADDTHGGPFDLKTALDEPDMEPMPDTVPSRRMVTDGDAVRVRRPPYPTPPLNSEARGPDPCETERFEVDWKPTSTLPSGLQSVNVDRATPSPPAAKKLSQDAFMRRKDDVRSPDIPISRDSTIRVNAQTAFRRLPPIARRILRRGANPFQIGEGESVKFGMAFIARGKLCAHVGPSPTCTVSLYAGTLIRRLPAAASMAEVRWMACGGPTQLVTWDESTTQRLLGLSPLLEGLLCAAAHRITAQACATTGPLGGTVCASMREDLYARSRLRFLAPHELLFDVGDDLPGLVIAGAGTLKQRDDQGRETLLNSGSVACPTAVFSREPAPVSLRASDHEASVLIADRSVLMELASAMPSLPELLDRC